MCYIIVNWHCITTTGLKIFTLSAHFRLFLILRTDFGNRPEPMNFFWQKSVGGRGNQMLLVIRSLFSSNLILSVLWDTRSQNASIRWTLNSWATIFKLPVISWLFHDTVFCPVSYSIQARKQASARPPPYELLYSSKHLITPYSSLHTHIIMFMFCFYALYQKLMSL